MGEEQGMKWPPQEGSGINPGELTVRVRRGPPAAHQDLCAYEDGRDGVQLGLGC